MGQRIAVGIVAAFGLCLPLLAAEMPSNPYAGQQARQIKALSEDDVAALQNGQGMGFAKAAELNGYPGPAHVLPLAGRLGLTAEQSAGISAIHARMIAEAKPLGAEIILREQALDQSFASRQITPDNLVSETAAIGELNGRLRAVHLAAHLEMRAILRPEQIALYKQLRGYDAPAAAPSHHHPG